MAERKPLISGNWKMHHNHFEAIQAVQKLSYLLSTNDHEAVDVSVHPPFTDLRSVQTVLEADEIPIALGAQHCHSPAVAALVHWRRRRLPAAAPTAVLGAWTPTTAAARARGAARCPGPGRPAPSAPGGPRR